MPYQPIIGTLGYICHENKVLMVHRNKRSTDDHLGKYNGLGGKMDGITMQSGFQISVSSELMAILAVTTDLADLRSRISKIVVAQSKSGDLITTADLEVE